MQYRVLVRQEDGTYWATVDELPGVFASGETLDELKEAVSEAITLALSDDDSAPVTQTAQVDEMRLLVPA
ncbi:MAG TPA: type II toxin-antitoxin system HicB family antitoxin [Gaiellaceae bacterium]|nr:type II toxin-antitoxin system HicB family antitoxin [Gaiellaceae bacterium]